LEILAKVLITLSKLVGSTTYIAQRGHEILPWLIDVLHILLRLFIGRLHIAWRSLAEKLAEIAE